MDNHQTSISHRYYPTQSSPSSSSSSSPSPSVSHPFTTVATNSTGGGAAKTLRKAPPTKESTTLRSFSCTSRSSSTTSSLATIRTSTSNSSLIETLRAETASCCPLCGFQILAVTTTSSTTNSSSNAGTGSELTASARASIADATIPYPKSSSSVQVQVQEHTYDDTASSSSWLRSFVIDQQEHLLRGCNHAVSSGFLETTATTKKTAGAVTTGPQADTKANNLPAGTCWVCLQAATQVEGQIEEDRKLAASLSAIISIEEQQDHSTGIYTRPPPHNSNNNAIHTFYGDQNCQVASPGDYRPRPDTTNNISYHPDQVLLPQEWLEEVQAPISTASTPAAKAHRIEEDEPQHQNYDHSNNTIDSGDKSDVTAYGDPCVYIGDYNILGQRHGSHGELIWDSGDRYVGTFKNGMRSGQGAFFFRDGKDGTRRFSSLFHSALYICFSCVPALLTLYHIYIHARIHT
jgi:hypothetical protein